MPLVSCSLQRVVLELCGDGVPHWPPGSPEGPEHDPGSGATPSVHSGALQSVCPGHHPDGQSEEVSAAGRRGGMSRDRTADPNWGCTLPFALF